MSTSTAAQVGREDVIMDRGQAVAKLKDIPYDPFEPRQPFPIIGP
jgi:hypothetical protein